MNSIVCAILGALTLWLAYRASPIRTDLRRLLDTPGVRCPSCGLEEVHCSTCRLYKWL